MKFFFFKVNFLDEDISNSDTDDSDDEEQEDNNLFSLPKLSSILEFPSLLHDKNLHIRNAYVNNKHICSEFILMIENKETIAISCFTKKITKPISGIIFIFIRNKKKILISFHD